MARPAAGEEGARVVIYVVSSPGFAKIGYTDDAERRLCAYRSHNPAVDRFDGVWDGGRGHEYGLRVMAQEVWPLVPGTEWFRAPVADVVAFVSKNISEALTCPGPKDRSRGSREFTSAIGSIGSAEVARRLGVVPSMVSHLRSGNRKPSLSLAVRIWEAFGVSPSAWVDDGEAPDAGDAE